jgi:hypothetical protein
MRPSTLIFVLLLLCCTNPLLNAEVVVNGSVDRSYYHIAYQLRASNFMCVHPDEYFDSRYPDIVDNSEIGENGHFVIYISKDDFPIKAPNCNSKWLKVEMRGGDSSAGIASKRRLWEQIKMVEEGKLIESEIIIELNPYVRVLGVDPLLLELEHCNLFFRTARGSYIASTEPLD